MSCHKIASQNNKKSQQEINEDSGYGKKDICSSVSEFCIRKFEIRNSIFNDIKEQKPAGQ